MAQPWFLLCDQIHGRKLKSMELFTGNVGLSRSIQVAGCRIFGLP